MTDTTISDAVAFPQDAGSGVPEDEEDYSSAGFFSLLSKYKGEGSYIGEDTSGDPTLQFNDVDTSNEQVDVSTGYAYIMDSMSVQSGFQTVYDVALPNDSPYVVILPDEVVNLDLGTDNVNDIWLAVDPTSNDSVYIRHGNGLTAPSDPFVKLGTVNTSSGATTRTNDGAPSGAFRDEDGDNVYTLPNSTDGINVGSVSTDSADIKTEGPIHKAWAYDGADADDRLSNAISAAVDGETIYMEGETYSEDRSISKEIDFVGTGNNSDRTNVTSQWIANSRISLYRVAFTTFEGEIVLNSDRSIVKNSRGGGTVSDITVSADYCLIESMQDWEVVFESGTTGGLVDSCIGVTVNDNSTNTVGDTT